MSVNPHESIVVPPVVVPGAQEREGARPFAEEHDGAKPFPEDDNAARPFPEDEKPHAETSLTLFPRTGLGTAAAYAVGISTNFRTDKVSYDIFLSGSAAGTITTKGFDTEQLNGVSVTANFNYASVTLEQDAGATSDVTVTLADAADPSRRGTATLSSDVESWQVGMTGTVGRFAVGDFLTADVTAGGGYYQIEVDPASSGDFALSGKTYFVISPPPGHWVTDPSEPGKIDMKEEQVFGGLYAEAGLKVGVKIWEGLEANAAVTERFYTGSAQAMQTRITFSIGWNF